MIEMACWLISQPLFWLLILLMMLIGVVFLHSYVEDQRRAK